MTDAERKIFEFGKWCMREARSEGGQDINGGDAQDKMVELQILGSIIVEEPCGEYCWCAGLGDKFPVECLRYPPDILEVIQGDKV